ncbi:serine/threonine-protein kinase [Pyxidicoccus xibeiensis]|uniref:serine/threonine-protein kinase n=1 Tax=Pyxidicoccus xibeiensis TaxID=2906759 RepID=UPI0020A7DE63|nr:serine/threonine-protein kinase [Pyxidicoccus xibeiensis]MCP3144953.1 protein kinase [Pyxidicoccus xibeiensis]
MRARMSMQGGAGDDPDRGRRIGKYEILTRLSMGGMAELFLAFTSGPGGFRKFVAVKQILPDIKKDDQFVKMFLDEARITAAFSHANIGQVFDLGEEGGELYLAMEFLPGQNLEQVVKAASRQGYALPMGFIGRVIRDACLGLHYAHHFTDPSGRPAVVVHRDVSPKNVMLTYDGVVKVIDFGIAKARGRLGRTQVGTVKGTSGYMSPEQVRNTALDGRSDLFSVGVMLHELLAGQRLFNGPHEAAVMLQIVEGDIPSPRSLNPEVPEALEAVAMRALARDAAQRFTSGREMARAIEAALGPELFDEDGITAVMGDLFAEKRQKTRTLLELASSAEDARVSEVAGALQQDDGGDSSPTSQVPAQRTRAAAATRAGSGPKPVPQRRPTETAAVATRVSTGSAPKPVPQRRPTETGVSASRTPRPTQGGEQVSRTPRPRPPPRQEAVEPEPDSLLDEPSDLATQRFRSRPPRPGAEGARTPGRPPRPATSRRSDTPVELPAARPASRWVGRLVLLAILGGLGWLSTLPAVRAQFVPAFESARAWVKAEMDPPPAVDPATNAPWPPPQKSGPPPGFPRGVEAPAPVAAAPEALAPEVAPPADAPDTASAGTEAPPEQKGTRTASAGTVPARKGKEGSSPANWASGSRTSGEEGKPAKRTKVKAEPETPAAEPVTTVTQNPEGMGEVLDTSTPKGAAKAGLGWITLHTVPRAAVFDGSTSLGTTPLLKFPLPVGTYRLRVVDPTDTESASRLLSAPIRPGEVTKIQIRLADLPLYKE